MSTIDKIMILWADMLKVEQEWLKYEDEDEAESDMILARYEMAKRVLAEKIVDFAEANMQTVSPSLVSPLLASNGSRKTSIRLMTVNLGNVVYRYSVLGWVCELEQNPYSVDLDEK